MADIFGGVEPPAWLQRLTTPSEPGMLGKIFGELVGGFADSAEIAMTKAGDKQSQGIDTNWIKELPGSIKPGLAEARLNIQNPLWKMQAQQAQLNMAEQGLRIQNEQTLIDARKTKLRMQEHDQDVLPKWLQDHPTWESRQSAEPPNLLTTEAQHMWHDVQMGDAQSVKTKSVVAAQKAFADQVHELRKLDPIAAGVFAGSIGKMITPQIQDALTQAMGKAKEKADKDKASAVPVTDPSGKVIGYNVDGRFQKITEKPDPSTAIPIKAGDKVIGYNVGGKFVKAQSDTTAGTEVMAGGKLIGYNVGGKFVKADKPAKPTSGLSDMQKAAQKADLDIAKKKVESIQSKLVDPKNSDMIEDKVGKNGNIVSHGLHTALIQAEAELNFLRNKFDAQARAATPAQPVKDSLGLGPFTSPPNPSDIASEENL